MSSVIPSQKEEVAPARIALMGRHDGVDGVVFDCDGLLLETESRWTIHACALLSVAPARTLALEDSPTGVAAARGAGLRVLGVPSLQDQELDAEAIVPSLASLAIDDATLELCWRPR